MKLHYPHPGWGEARWDAHEDVHVDVALAVRALAELPGVRYYVGPEWTSLEVPRNAWSTRAWSLLTSTDWPPAVASRLQSVEYPSARKAAARAFVETHLWAPKQPLYAHQTEAARFLVANQGGLCADQMGLGKTRTAIVAAQSLAADFGSERPRVVIAPGYTRDVWRRELLATGAIKKPEQMSAAFTRDPTGEDFDWDAPWWFIHYDIAWWWRGYMALRRRPVVAILDEIHWIKNGRAQRSKGAAAIAGAASARIGLTGTPISNRPAELWWPLTVIDGSGTWGSPKDFRERYCGAVHDGYGLHDTGPTNVDELGIRLSDRYIRRTIDSAGVTLPPLTRTTHLVPLSSKDLAKHEGLVTEIGYEKLLEAITRGSAGKDTLARITRLRKLVSTAKLDATVQLATDMLEQGESVVVFTWQKKTAERIIRKLPEGTGVAVHGDFPQDARDRHVQNFQDYGGALVATLGALREGVTLTAARHLILHDLDWVPANILQAEARVYRIGQERPSQVTWMLAEQSIDVMLARVLVEKSRVMAETLGIDAAQEAVLELDLPAFVGPSAVEQDVARLLRDLGV